MSAVFSPELKPKLEVSESSGPPECIEVDPLAASFEQGNSLVFKSSPEMEMHDDVAFPGLIKSEPLTVGMEQENSYVLEPKLEMVVSENLEPPGSMSAHPQAGTLKQENATNMFLNTDCVTPIYSLVPSLKVEPGSESLIRNSINSEFITSSSCEQQDILLGTDSIMTEKGFTKTTASYATSSDLRLFSPSESSAETCTELNNGGVVTELANELIIGNCNAPLLPPARESLLSLNTQTSCQSDRPMRAIANASARVGRKKLKKKSRRGMQVAHEKVDVKVSHNVNRVERVTRSSMKLRASEKTAEFTKDGPGVKNPSEGKYDGQSLEMAVDEPSNLEESTPCLSLSTTSSQIIGQKSESAKSKKKRAKDKKKKTAIETRSNIRLKASKKTTKTIKIGPCVTNLSGRKHDGQSLEMAVYEPIISNLEESTPCLSLSTTSSQIIGQKSESAKSKKKRAKDKKKKTKKKTAIETRSNIRLKASKKTTKTIKIGPCVTNPSKRKCNRRAPELAIGGLIDLNLNDSVDSISSPITSSQIIRQRSKSTRRKKGAAKNSSLKTTCETENYTSHVVSEGQDALAVINPDHLKANSNLNSQVKKNKRYQQRLAHKFSTCSPHKNFRKKSGLELHRQQLHLNKRIFPKRLKICLKSKPVSLSKDIEVLSSSGTSVTADSSLLSISGKNDQTEESMDCQTSESSPCEMSSVSENGFIKSKLSFLEMLAAVDGERLKVFKITLSPHPMSKKQVSIQDKIHFIPSKGWGCDFCGKIYTDRYGLISHKKTTHYDINEFLCSICQKVFKSPVIFKQHEKDCNTHLYKCSFCEKSFAKMLLYERHYNLEHASPIVYTCIECSIPRHFDNRPDLYLHVKLHHVNKYIFPCKICKEPIANVKMERHMRVHNKQILQAKFYRLVRGELFANLSNHGYHSKTHSCPENTFSCKFCGIIFYKKSVLTQHLMEMHEGNSSTVNVVQNSTTQTQSIQAQVSRDANDCSHGRTSDTGLMPVISTGHGKDNQLKLQNELQEHTELSCEAENLLAIESTQCETVNSSVSEAPAVSKGDIKERKLSEVRVAKESTQCETVNSSVSEAPAVSKGDIKERKLSEVRVEKESTQCETVNSSVSEAPAISKGDIKERKLSEVRAAKESTQCETANSSVSEALAVSKGDIKERKLSEVAKESMLCETMKHSKDLSDPKFHFKIHPPPGNTFTCKFCGMIFYEESVLMQHLTEQHDGTSNTEYVVQDSICETQSVQVQVLRATNEYSSNATSVTANGYPMPIIFTGHDMNNQSKLQNQPQQDNESSSEVENLLAKESTQCETVNSSVSEAPAVSKGNIKERKLSELQMAASQVNKTLKITKVTLSSHRLSRKHVVIQEELHYIEGVGWGCDICGMVYANRERIKEHKRIHHQINVFICKTCKEIFNATDKFLRHYNNCGTKRYQCPACGKVYGKMDRYEEHYKLKHKPLVVYTCIECSPPKNFENKFNLYFHIKCQHVDKYIFPCKACGKLVSEKRMKRHMSTHDKKNVQCHICKKHFTAVKKLRAHLRIHSAMFPCKFCEKGFKLKVELVKHLKEHENMRSFICENCGKTFFTKAHLVTHLKSHENKQFICSKCHRGFVLKHQLIAHLGTIACGPGPKTASKRLKKKIKTGKRKGKQK